jgi:GH18 family chitinase
MQRRPRRHARRLPAVSSPCCASIRSTASISTGSTRARALPASSRGPKTSRISLRCCRRCGRNLETGLYASAFAEPSDRNADASVKQHLAAGIPPQKLVLGVAFYGRGFAGVTPLHDGLNQPYERFEAAHPYSELVAKFIDRGGFVREWDAKAQAPFLWNAQTRAFITYDDPQSIAIKAEYVRKHRLGGVMFWELSQDSGGVLLDAIVTGLK